MGGRASGDQRSQGTSLLPDWPSLGRDIGWRQLSSCQLKVMWHHQTMGGETHLKGLGTRLSAMFT